MFTLQLRSKHGLEILFVGDLHTVSPNHQKIKRILLWLEIYFFPNSSKPCSMKIYNFFMRLEMKELYQDIWDS
jgi:hypothetical protein